MEILRLQNVGFTYPGQAQPVLQNISFSVQAGELVLLCGASGSGKSTLLRLIKRELAPYGEAQGQILYREQPQEQLDPRTAAADLAFVQQSPENGVVTDTVWHELAFGLESLGLPTSVIRQRVAEMANYFGIEGWFHKKTAELSGGQKQLLHLAAAMVLQPQILLLDEPTAQLDPIAATEFLNTLHRLNRDFGLTVLLAEHRLEESFSAADRVLVLQGGTLQFSGDAAACGRFFARHPHHPLHAALPAALQVHTQLQGDGAAPLTVRQGRAYIQGRYANKIQALPTPPALPAGTPLLQVQEGWFRYRRELPDVLKGTRLTVFLGEHLCILGGNGSGKTTLLRILAGAQSLYRGRVTLMGKPIEKYTPAQLYRQNIALLPQDPQALFLEKTVQLDLLEQCRTLGLMAPQADAAVARVAEQLGLTPRLSTHPYDLSGGEQQLAALAKILLGQPKILLLDEPTKGVDAGHKAHLQAILQGLTQSGVTIVTVTHDVEFAAGCAHRCALFFDGDITACDTPRSFFCQNYFYTTAAHRMSRGYYTNALLCKDVVALCQQNGAKEGENETL